MTNKYSNNSIVVKNQTNPKNKLSKAVETIRRINKRIDKFKHFRSKNFKISKNFPKQPFRFFYLKYRCYEWATVMLVTTLCWWLYDDNFMMFVLALLCWWLFSPWWWLFQCWVLVTNSFNRSLRSQSVTNINRHQQRHCHISLQIGICHFEQSSE